VPGLRDIDGLIELGLGGFFHQLQRFIQRNSLLRSTLAASAL
jgi:hypothetical protein